MQPHCLLDRVEGKIRENPDRMPMHSPKVSKLEPVPSQRPKMASVPTWLVDSGSVPSVPGRQIAYDECTIRMMFIEMDGDSNGTVTKDEFINYVRSRPQLQSLMYDAWTSVQSSEQPEVDCDCSTQRVRAMGHHRLIKVYKDMDTNRNGVLQWEEFFAFFERTGLLLKYSTSDNPRDRMAAVLASESRRRQTLKKWQKGGAAFGVGQEAKREDLAEALHSKFLIDQKQAQVNTQWAAETLAKLGKQIARGTDAFSIVAHSLDAFKEAGRVLGPPGRRHKKAQQEFSTATPETIDTEMSSVIGSQRSSPNVSMTPVTPSTPEPKMSELPTVSTTPVTLVRPCTAELKTSGLHVVGQDVNDANPMPSGDPSAEEQAWSQRLFLPVQTSSQIVQLPKIQHKPARMNSKSPRRRKARSNSNLCETSQTKCVSPTKCQQTSPKRSPSRRNVKTERSVSPIKRVQNCIWNDEFHGYIRSH